MYKQHYFLCAPEGEPGSGNGGGAPGSELDPGTGGTPDPNGNPNPSPNDPPPADPPPNDSIYGDLQVQWPEGIDETLKNDPSLKPFVDEKGVIRQASLLKSYRDTKSAYGKEKVVLPTEKSFKEEIDEFYSKVNGYDPVIENYKVEAKMDTKLDGEFLEKLRIFGHEQRMTPKQVESLRDLLDEQVAEDDIATQKQNEELHETHLTALKTEWGDAYTPKVEAAKNLINEYLGEDEVLMKTLKDPSVGSNPVMIKILGTIASKLYKEGTFGDGNKGGVGNTPQDIEDKINAILGDPKHPYNIAGHAEKSKANREMLNLYEQRAKYRNNT